MCVPMSDLLIVDELGCFTSGVIPHLDVIFRAMTESGRQVGGVPFIFANIGPLQLQPIYLSHCYLYIHCIHVFYV
jgi:hypothetical protein